MRTYIHTYVCTHTQLDYAPVLSRFICYSSLLKCLKKQVMFCCVYYIGVLRCSPFLNAFSFTPIFPVPPCLMPLSPQVLTILLSVFHWTRMLDRSYWWGNVSVDVVNTHMWGFLFKGNVYSMDALSQEEQYSWTKSIERRCGKMCLCMYNIRNLWDFVDDW